MAMHNTLTNELISVSDKFKPQIGQFLATDPMIEGHEALQERIKKACGYFAEKTDQHICKVLQNTEIETDNKATRKVLKESFENFYQEAFIKTACFKASMSGFTVKNYLAAKAIAAIEKIQLKPEPKPKVVAFLGGKADSSLLQEIKTWRKSMADEENLPIYMVLPQKTMYDVVELLPVTIRELSEIKGFGKKKVQKYGDDIIGIIRNYLQVNHLNKIDVELPESETELPEEETVSKQKPKGQTQRLSFDMFKEGKTIEEIANERSFTISTIESHLARFVASGELDILKLIPLEKLEMIKSHFVESGNSSITEAKAVLGDAVSYGELRMVMNYLSKGISDPPPKYIL
jgi:hypothetical protein